MCKRFEIYYANLDPVIGSEQGGHRPVLVIQNDVGNAHSPTTIVALITTAPTKHTIPTHVWLNPSCGLPRNSMVLCEQIRTIDKSRLGRRVGRVIEDAPRINRALRISMEV